MLYRRGVVAAVKSSGEAFFRATTPQARLNIIKGLAADICSLYGKEVPVITLSLGTSGNAHGSCSDQGIKLVNKVSLVTFLHELYHWLTLGTNVCGNETIARQWSGSLFIRALPAHAHDCIIGFGSITYSKRQSARRVLRRILPLSPVADSPAEATPAAVTA